MLSIRRCFKGVLVALPSIIYGWLSFLAFLYAIRELVLIIPPKTLIIVALRFVIAGFITIIWLLSWWFFTVYYKKYLITNDEHGG